MALTTPDLTTGSSIELYFQNWMADRLKDRYRREESELRRLLGMWVSELEPATFFAREGSVFLGIGPVGHRRPVLWTEEAIAAGYRAAWRYDL